MSQENHIIKLREKHAALETQIHELSRHPSADALEVQRLKAQKLHIKDEIERLLGR